MEKKSRYKLTESPFYRMRSKQKLADILGISVKEIHSLTEGEKRYTEFQKPKNNGKWRDISNPIAPLKKIQSRINKLFQRVYVPDYVFGSVPGRSYAKNAALHANKQSLYKLDIESFFPNCTLKKAYWFFSKKMECSSDVAIILAKLITHKGSLPQGSPCSSILSYFIYIDMWDDIALLVQNSECQHTTYIDDITISGDTVPRNLIWQIKKILRKYGHKCARHKEKSCYRKKIEITGVIVGENGVFAPSRQYKKLHDAKLMLSNNSKQSDTDKINKIIVGLQSQIKQILTA